MIGVPNVDLGTLCPTLRDADEDQRWRIASKGTVERMRLRKNMLLTIAPRPNLRVFTLPNLGEVQFLIYPADEGSGYPSKRIARFHYIM